jgi:Tol biopolymer transport system component
MTDDRTLERAARSWIEQGPTRAPDRAVAAALDRIQTTPQDRNPWIRRRLPTMFSNRLAIAAVVVVLIVAGTFTVTRLASIGAPGSTSSPTPTATPSAAPTAAPASPTLVAIQKPPFGAAIVGLDGSIRQALAIPRSAWAATLSKDGSKVAYVDAGRLWVQPIAAGSVARDTGELVTGAVQSLFSNFPVDAAPAWSPDGTRLAYVSAGDIFVLDLNGSAPARRLTTDPQLDEWPAWSPDGTTIFYVNEGATPIDNDAISSSQEVWRVAASGGSPKRITTNDVAELQPDLSSAGQMAIWEDGNLRIMDATTGRTTRFLRPSDSAAITLPQGWNPRWSPDGSKVAMLVFDPSARTSFDPALGLPRSLNGIALMQVEVFDLETGQASVVGPRVAAFWNPVSWTPDGQALLINRFDDGT